MEDNDISEYGLASGKKIESKAIESLKKNVVNMLPTSSLKEVSDVIMNEAKHLTGSQHCYVAYVDPENMDSVGISFSHMTGGCDMYEKMGEARFKVRKDGSYGGLLGYSLDTGESFYVRDPSKHPASHGLPKGHEPVSQFLSVPVKYNNKILGQIVLGNPEMNYTSHNVDLADAVAEVYAVALKKFLY
jgi:GAF domain-containing protein